jgi:tRNA dimethylallyltransferase
MKTNLIVILGPTASGKTSLAVKLASGFGGEIISADSRQVYRGMDIGTGKDLSEYCINGKMVRHHLIDIAEPFQEFNVFEFQKRFYSIFKDLTEKKKVPILVGGTGLYLESVLSDYIFPEALPDDVFRRETASKPLEELQNILLAMKPDLHNKTDLEDRERLMRKIEIEKARRSVDGEPIQKTDVKAGVFGVLWDRSVLRRRIAERLKKRLNNGMIEEVSRLHEEGLSWDRLDSFGLEYRYIARFLQNQMTKEQMAEKLQIAIGQFAKRQMTWFRRMEKKGVAIEWICGDDHAYFHRRVSDLLS